MFVTLQLIPLEAQPLEFWSFCLADLQTKTMSRFIWCCFSNNMGCSSFNPIGLGCRSASLRKVQASHCRRDGIAGASGGGSLVLARDFWEFSRFISLVCFFNAAQIGCCCLSWHLSTHFSSRVLQKSKLWTCLSLFNTIQKIWFHAKTYVRTLGIMFFGCLKMFHSAAPFLLSYRNESDETTMTRLLRFRIVRSIH